MYAQNTFPWLDNSLDTEYRISSLISAMSLDEKVSQLTHNSAAIDRLGIPEYNWWNECLHGVARNGRATVFPQAIALAATFDEELAFRVASAISDEARAKFNVAQSIGNRGQYAGLSFWTPNINIFRDPRWGRGQETYGEDPFLTSRIAVNFIRGLQGDHPVYLKTAACAKHFAVHSGPEALRHEFNAVVSQKDLWETYLPAFEASVREAKVEAIMGAYNRTNGESCCASPYLFREVLEKKWGFKGNILSDCWGVSDIYQFHKMVDTEEEAAAMAVKAGMDLNCGVSFRSLDRAVQKALLTEQDIDAALSDLLRSRFKLGLLDPPADNPYNSIGTEVVGSKEHRLLAREVAHKAIVLLKNDKEVLPLKKDIRSLMVIGPQATNSEVLMGNYYGVSGNDVSILDGISSAVSLGTTINFKYGQMPYRKNVNPIDWVTGEAKSADACIAVMGINGLWEGEEGEAIASEFKGDRSTISLPQNQVEFIKKLGEGRTNPLILVLTGGSPIALPEVYDFVDAILLVWYPGQEGGRAVADILFGDVSPSGKLPFTVPYSVKDLPPYEDYAMRGRTYRYMEKEPQFPFGFGLTYGELNLSKVELGSASLKKGDDLKIKLDLTNLGDSPAEEVVQVYIQSPDAGKGQPFHSLKAFSRVRLKPFETREVKWLIKAKDLQLIDERGEPFFKDGKYKVLVGNASPGKRSEELGAKMLAATFVLR
jgi:beta-glucosidase